MWWESSSDKTDSNTEDGGVGGGQKEKGGESLINIVVQGMGGFEGRRMERRGNWLGYPRSRFENLRRGMEGE